MKFESARKSGVFLAAAVVAVGGIIYELLLGAMSSYLLGDSVLQFSLTIGLFLFGMGIGSFIAPHIGGPPEEKFILIESVLAIAGGNSVLILYAAYVYTPLIYLVFVLLVVFIGVLTGAEIPLLLRMFERDQQTVVLVSRILSLDYMGALLASLLFPLLLLPSLGIMPTAYLVGLSNMGVALMLYWLFRRHVPMRRLIVLPVLVLGTAIMAAGFAGADRLARTLESRLYNDTVVYSRQSQYQKIVLTQFNDDVRLYLNGHLQFSSLDEHRYHEALVHVPLGLAASPEKVLILGGGDGLTARELLKYPRIGSITLVDIDAVMTGAASSVPYLTALNQHSLKNGKVRIINQDAMQFLRGGSELFDVIIIDLPDPASEELAKLYSREFYWLVQRRMARDGIMAAQTTSPRFFHDSFWIIHTTIKSAGLAAIPYHTRVPSFGDWGFVVAAKHPLNVSRVNLSVPTRYLNAELVPRLFVFDNELEAGNREFPVSTFYNPVVLHAYQREKRLLERE